MNERSYKLWEYLRSKQLYTKDWDDFQQQFSDPENQYALWNLMKQKQLYTKNSGAFQEQFFSTRQIVEPEVEPEKKNELSASSPPSGEKSKEGFERLREDYKKSPYKTTAAVYQTLTGKDFPLKSKEDDSWFARTVKEGLKSFARSSLMWGDAVEPIAEDEVRNNIQDLKAKEEDLTNKLQSMKSKADFAKDALSSYVGADVISRLEKTEARRQKLEEDLKKMEEGHEGARVRNTMDYMIGKGFNESIGGLLYETIKGEEAVDLTGYDASTLEDFGASLVGLAVMDAPFFGMGGKLGSMIAKGAYKGGKGALSAVKLAGMGAKKTEQTLIKLGVEKSLAKRMATDGAEKVITSLGGSAGALGSYNAAHNTLAQMTGRHMGVDAEGNVYDPGERVPFEDIDWAMVKDEGLIGAGTGLGLGFMSMGLQRLEQFVGKRMIDNSAEVAVKRGFNVAELTGEVSVFVTVDPALRKLMGQDVEPMSGEDILHTFGIIAGMRGGRKLTRTPMDFRRAKRFKRDRRGEEPYDVTFNEAELEIMNRLFLKKSATSENAVEQLKNVSLTTLQKNAKLLPRETVEKILWSMHGVRPNAGYALDKASYVEENGKHYVELRDRENNLLAKELYSDRAIAESVVKDYTNFMRISDRLLRAQRLPEEAKLEIDEALKKSGFQKGLADPLLFEVLNKSYSFKTPKQVEATRGVVELFDKILKQYEKLEEAPGKTKGVEEKPTERKAEEEGKRPEEKLREDVTEGVLRIKPEQSIEQIRESVTEGKRKEGEKREELSSEIKSVRAEGEEGRRTVKGGIKETKKGVEITDELTEPIRITKPEDVSKPIKEARRIREEARKEIERRKEGYDEDAPLRIYNKTYQTKKEFLKAFEDLAKSGRIDAEILMGNDIKHKDISLSELTKIAERVEPEGRMYVSKPEVTSTPELEARMRMMERREERLQQAREMVGGKKEPVAERDVVSEIEGAEKPLTVTTNIGGKQRGEQYTPRINKDGSVDFITPDGKKLPRKTDMYKRLRNQMESEGRENPRGYRALGEDYAFISEATAKRVREQYGEDVIRKDKKGLDENLKESSLSVAQDIASEFIKKERYDTGKEREVRGVQREREETESVVRQQETGTKEAKGDRVLQTQEKIKLSEPIVDETIPEGTAKRAIVREGKEIGELSYRRMGDEAEIDFHFLQKGHRGKGYGRESIKQLGDELAQQGTILRSDKPSRMTKEAEGAWKALVKEGFAEKLEDGRYEYTGKVERGKVDVKGVTEAVITDTPVNRRMRSKIEKLQQQLEAAKEEPKRMRDMISKFLDANKNDIKKAKLSAADLKALTNAKTWTQVGRAIEKITSKIEKSKPTIEEMRQNIKDYIDEHKDDLKGVRGNVINVMARRINAAKTERQIQDVIEYMDKIVQSKVERDKAEMIGKAIELSDISKKLETMKGAIKKAKPQHRTRMNEQVAEHLESLERIHNNILEMNPRKYEEIVNQGFDKLAESGVGKKELSPDAKEQIRRAVEEAEFGRMWDMNRSQLKEAIDKIKFIDKTGRTEIQRMRHAEGKHYMRIRKFLGEYFGGVTKWRGHPGRAQEKYNRFWQQLSIQDADYSSLLNRMGKHHGGMREFTLPWWMAIRDDAVGLHINQAKLNKRYTDIYNSIAKDVDVMLQNTRQAIEGSDFLYKDRFIQESRGVTKKNAEEFINLWYDDIPVEARKHMDKFAKTIEAKYDDIRKNTNAWLKEAQGRDPLQRLMHTDLIRRGEEGAAKEHFEFRKEFNEATMEILGGGRNTMAYRRIMFEIRQPVIDHGIEVVGVDGKVETKTPISKMQALQKILEWKDPDARKKMERRPERTEDGFIGDGMGITEKSIEQMRKFVGEDILRLGDWLRTQYDSWGEKIQPAFKREYGWRLELRPDYVPTTVLPAQYTGEFDADMLVRSQDLTRGIANNRFKSRVTSEQPLAWTDAMTVFNHYVSSMIRFKNFAEPLRKTEYIWRDPKISSLIAEKFGHQYNKQLNDFMARWGGTYERQQHYGLDLLMNNISKGILFLKTAVGAKQLLSTMYYMADMPMHELMGSIVEITSPVKSKTTKAGMELLREQPYFADRLSARRGLDIDIEKVLANRQYHFNATGARALYEKYKKASDKFGIIMNKETFDSALGSFLRYGDRLPALLGGWGYLKRKYKHFSNGKKLTEKIIQDHRSGRKTDPALERALEQWSIMSEMTQQSTRMSKVSNFRASSTFARMFTQFTSGPGQVHRNVLMSGRDMLRELNAVRKGTGYWSDVARHAKAMAVQHVLGGALFGFAGNGFSFKRTFGTEEGRQDFLWSLAIGNLKGVALLGRGLELAYAGLTEKPWVRGSLESTPVGQSLTRLLYDGVIGAIMNWNDPAKRNESLLILAEMYARIHGVNLEEGVELYQIWYENFTTGEIDWLEVLGLKNPAWNEKVGTIDKDDKGNVRRTRGRRPGDR